MLTPQQTWSTLSEHLALLPDCALPLDEAHGHVLAEPAHADRDLPPADRSAMDGFAVRATDLENAPVTLRVIGEVAESATCDV